MFHRNKVFEYKVPQKSSLGTKSSTEINFLNIAFSINQFLEHKVKQKSNFNTNQVMNRNLNAEQKSSLGTEGTTEIKFLNRKFNGKQMYPVFVWLLAECYELFKSNLCVGYFQQIIKTLELYIFYLVYDLGQLVQP